MRVLAVVSVLWLGILTPTSFGAEQKPLTRIPSSKSSHLKFPSLIDATLDDLTRGLEDGLFSSVELTKAYLARIHEVNSTLHVVTEVNPDALDIAASLDQQRLQGIIKGPLHGVPILIKNNIATKDKMNNTAGSWLLLGAKVPREATTVIKLRQAGAIILGKTNLGEWAQCRGSLPQGWSAHGGQTYGAYHEKQNPGGSSSGSGVAADLGLSLASLGTETDGSIIFPAHKNNVVGIKPTVGLTSRHMVIPVSEHQDTVGPLAKTVRDAAILLQVIAGKDPRDNYTSAIPPEIPDYVAACNRTALQGARIGIPWNIMESEGFSPSPEELDVFKGALKELVSSGAIIVTANFTSGLDLAGTDAMALTAWADLNINLSQYLAELTENPNDIHSLADIQAKTSTHPLEQYPRYNTIGFDMAITQGWNNTDPRYWPAHEELQRICGSEGIYGAMDSHQLDALVMPSSIASPFPAFIGAPIVGVPMGHYPESTTPRKDESGELISHGPRIPMGLSFLGRRWEEAKLIGLAYSYEQHTNVRQRDVKRVIQPTIEI